MDDKTVFDDSPLDQSGQASDGRTPTNNNQAGNRLRPDAQRDYSKTGRPEVSRFGSLNQSDRAPDTSFKSARLKYNQPPVSNSSRFNNDNQNLNPATRPKEVSFNQLGLNL